MDTVYTVGHGLLPIETLVENLRSHDVTVVVDVRSQPFSRRAPQFNKDSLRASLEAAGIGYAWMGHALGGRPPDELRTSTGAPDYERMAQEPATATALGKVAEASTRRRIALLCSESRPEGCHRSRMLEPQLGQRGVVVEHILPDGTLVVHPRLFV